MRVFGKSVLDWFNRPRRFTRCDDMYASTRESLWNAVRKTIQAPIHQQKSIWLVTHFTDTFLALQSQLERWQVEYEVITKPFDQAELEQSQLLAPGTIKLVLAELVNFDLPDPSRFATERLTREAVNQAPLSETPRPSLAMILVERHPHLKHDQRIESFARSLNANVEFGYFNALDDVVLAQVMSPTTMTVLHQLGLNDHELITSVMISRRLTKVLRRAAEQYPSDLPADSASEWLKLNSIPVDDETR